MFKTNIIQLFNDDQKCDRMREICNLIDEFIFDEMTYNWLF